MMLYIWKQNIKRLHPKQSAQTIWDWSVEYAKKLYTHDGEINTFNLGFRWDGNEWVKREAMKYEIGWCGQNASLAVSFLYDYQMNGNKAVSYTHLDVYKRQEYVHMPICKDDEYYKFEGILKLSLIHI